MSPVQVLVALTALALTLGCRQEVTPADGTALKPATLQVRLILDAPVGDSEEMTFTNKDRFGARTQEMLHVGRTELLNESAVKATWIWKRGEVVGMDITLTDQGRKQLADLTRRNIRKRVAIVIDGRVRSAPKIDDEISNGRFTVTSDWSLGEVDQLAQRFEAGGAMRSK
jgi:preprotein translocase subunit SecD